MYGVAQLGNKNRCWKGDGVSYKTLHQYLRRHNPPPDLCEKCELVPPKHIANITGIYNRDISNYQHLCIPCHRQLDNMVDMSGRICFFCKTDKTVTQIYKIGPRPHWRYVNGKLACNNCYQKYGRRLRNI